MNHETIPRRRFLQLAGRLGALLGMASPRLEAIADPTRSGKQRKIAQGSATLAVSLNDGWLIATDPGNTGREQSWFQIPHPDAKPTRVPSVLQETFPAYHGVVWYWLQFEPERNKFENGRYLLRFHAVDYQADVWLNANHLGSHEGGETPFDLDATAFLRPGTSNTLALRVINPIKQPIDGLVLGQTPHRNKVVQFQNGSCFDFGGIVQPVELILTPEARIASLWVRPQWTTGRVKIECVIQNDSKQTRRVQVRWSVTRSTSDEPLLTETTEFEAHTGESTLEHEVAIPNHRLWELDDPYLYALRASLQVEDSERVHEASTRFGFRDFRVVRGYFRLNGRRIFLKSTHTGNHVPFGQVVPPAGYPDLLRRDLLYAKASGFNMVRFISGLAYPYEITLCDELGLLVYEETSASWLLEDSPRMKARYESSIREMILRDRNHPSLVIWGMLNETADGPIFREAVSALPLVRSLDETRLVLLSSGRFDGQLSIGSVSNPGSSEWEATWGAEASGAPTVAINFPSGVGIGDFHLYPIVPQSAEVNQMMRTLGENSKPVFLSEYGIGSMMDVMHEAKMYDQAGIREDAEDYVLMRSMANRLKADWSRFAMESAYPDAETLLVCSQAAMAHHRLLGFDLIRSNKQICGFNLTGMLDHAMTGEGLWRFWRDWKPGSFDAVRNGWAPVRWCLFAAPGHTYLGRPVLLEAVLANEDTLRPAQYPSHFRVLGPAGLAWEHHAEVSIPAAISGQDGPLALPVLKQEVVIQGPAGEYTLMPSIENAAPPEAQRKFYLSDPQALPTLKQAAVTWRLPEKVTSWLNMHGVKTTPFEAAEHPGRALILVGNVAEATETADAWQRLAARMATGSTVIFLSPSVFQRDKDTSAWLPLKNKGRIYQFHDWLYHKECVAKPHAIFQGLQGSGILDWDYYGPVLPHVLFDGQDTPTEVIAAAFAAGYSTPGGYASGVLLGSYKFAAGQFLVNTFPILENLDAHPAADRLLLNLIAYAAPSVEAPAAALPKDFSDQLKQMRYND